MSLEEKCGEEKGENNHKEYSTPTIEVARKNYRYVTKETYKKLAGSRLNDWLITFGLCGVGSILIESKPATGFMLWYLSGTHHINSKKSFNAAMELIGGAKASVEVAYNSGFSVIVDEKHGEMRHEVECYRRGPKEFVHRELVRRTSAREKLDASIRYTKESVVHAQAVLEEHRAEYSNLGRVEAQRDYKSILYVLQDITSLWREPPSIRERTISAMPRALDVLIVSYELAAAVLYETNAQLVRVMEQGEMWNEELGTLHSITEEIIERYHKLAQATAAERLVYQTCINRGMHL